MIREINLIEVLECVVSVATLKEIEEAGIEKYYCRLTEIPTKYSFGMPRPSEITSDIIRGIQKQIRISPAELHRMIEKLVKYECAERKKIRDCRYEMNDKDYRARAAALQMSLETSKQEEN